MDLSEPYSSVCPSLEGPVLDVLAHTTRPLTGSEVARLARRGSERGVRLVLRRLVAHGLVSAQDVGSASLFLLNRDHVAASVVEGLVGLRAELLARIRRDLEDWAIQPIHVSIFGSAARGDGSLDSDVDLLIVRSKEIAEDNSQWREQLHSLAERVERWSGNRASLHDISLKELKSALRRQEPIVESLRDSSVVLIGPEFSELIADLNRKAIA